MTDLISDPVETDAQTKQPTLLFLAIGAGIITIACAIIYGKLFINPEAIPWGSDTLGHVFRYESLRRSIEQGIWFPDFVPEWYLGIQLFRYYPPLLYYPLALLSPLFKNPIVLSTWFIVVCAWLGGISWLMFHRKIGWFSSVLGGVLYLLLPDMIRVVFAEGNLLRHFANTLLPLTLFLLITSIEAPKKRVVKFWLGLCFALMVLSHPMIASITAAMSVLYLTLYSLLYKIPFLHGLKIFLSMVLGILVAAFWLLPSLTGGITELSKEAMIAGLPVVSVVSLFSPSTRAQNMESLYVGFSLLFFPIGCFLVSAIRKNKKFWALMLTGAIGCLLVTPLFNQLFYALPLSTLMWPARFLTTASVFLLFASLWSINIILQQPWQKHTKKIILGLVLLLFVFDFRGPQRLIFNRETNGEYTSIASQLPAKDGWRQATLDYSTMASNPAYYVSEYGQREQIFGWGFQGARTAGLVAGINESLSMGNIPYATDRLNLIGADDLWIANQIPQPYGLETFLNQEGFEQEDSSATFDTYHRQGSPRAIITPSRTAAIGATAQNYAFLFPQVIILDSPFIDDYTMDQLRSYQQIILAGFTWHNKSDAEILVTQLAQSGVSVVIDLTKSKENPLSQQPNFLDVWGEPVILDQNPMTIAADGKTYHLSPFHNEDELWYTLTPQNLDHNTLSSDFLGQSLVLTGYKQVNSGKVWFVGLNLAYHAVINQDAGAAAILEDVLQLKSGVVTDYQTIEMSHYTKNGKLIEFQIALDTPQSIILPFAHFDGTQVMIDGVPTPTMAASSLIQIQAPAGNHHYTILFKKPIIYTLGTIVSVLAIVSLTALSFSPWRKNDVE